MDVLIALFIDTVFRFVVSAHFAIVLTNMVYVLLIIFCFPGEGVLGVFSALLTYTSLFYKVLVFNHFGVNIFYF